MVAHCCILSGLKFVLYGEIHLNGIKMESQFSGNYLEETDSYLKFSYYLNNCICFKVF